MGPRKRNADDCDCHDHHRDQPPERHVSAAENNPEDIQQQGKRGHLYLPSAALSVIPIEAFNG